MPTDRPLASWIRELIAMGRLYRFYKTDEWIELAGSVMDAARRECEWCRDNPGKPVRATCVHHEMEVRDHPELALSRTYTAADGTERRNLWAICDACHNRAHGRFQGARKKRGDEKPLTPEMW
ncbi:hypothetical protein [Adlercreutzia mucosicola]|uniref:hypothetical protein n=1 Tax=Adlercreutzia mucosicola TaxID=580026 RepID=UPI000409FCFC|nr:hypothetical protein [Adlercreutzia mucosicola]